MAIQQQKKYYVVNRVSVLFMVTWVLLLISSFYWNIHQIEKSALALAESETRLSFDKDLVYRRWVSSHGGVYVRPTEKSPPNPYLSHLPNRDITTAQGKNLTLINPAYMTRQVHELGMEKYGHRGHITSLEPLRPENAADAWEREALQAFEAGEKEMLSVEMIEGQPYLRFMRPMITEENCLECHGHQGYSVGEVRGGISVSTSLTPYLDEASKSKDIILFSHVLAGIIGLSGLMLVNIALRRSETVLEDSRQYYRSLIHSLHEDIQVIDLEYRITDINKMAEEKLGMNREEVIGRHCYKLLHGLDAPCSENDISCGLQEVLETGQPCKLHHIKTDSDGRPTHHDVLTSPLKDNNGNISHVIRAVRDVTTLFSAEQAAQESERRYKNLSEVSPSGIWETDSKGNNTYVSARWSEITGVPAEEAIGKGWERNIHPEDQEAIADEWYRSAQADSRYRSKFRFVRPSGGSVWVLCVANSFTDPKTNQKKWVGTITDITDLVEALDMVAESEKKFRSLVEQATDAVLLCDFNGRFVDVNQRACELLGYTRRELLELGVGDVDPYFTDYGRFEKVRGKTIKQKRMQFESTHRRKDGMIFPVEVSIGPMKLEDKTYFIGIVRDCSDRKQAENALKESHTRYELVLDGAAGGIWDWDVANKRVHFSPGWKKMRGYNEDEIGDSETDWSSGIHPEDFPRVMEAVQSHFEGNTPVFEMEYRVRCKDGSWMWIIDRGKAVSDSAGNIIRMAGSEFDITTRKEVQQALQESESILKLAQEVAQLGSWSYNINSKELYWSDELYRIYGLDLPAQRAASFDTAFKLVHPDDVGSVTDTWRKAIEQGVSFDIEYRIVLPNGKERFVLAIGRVEKDEDGKILSVFGTNQDITELALYRTQMADLVKEQTIELDRALAEITEVHQLKTDFLSMAAHELRTPLTSIQGFSEIMLMRQLSEKDRTRYVNIINQQATHLGQIVNDMLDIARLESGRGMEIVSGPIDMTDIIDDTLQLFIKEDSDHIFHFEKLPEPALVAGDSFRLAQVCTNILSNAVKYSPAGGKINVKMSLQENFLEVMVQDEGIGMSTVQQKHLFEKFYRAESANTGVKGTGLGMAISKTIVDLHGGNIDVESEVDAGTKVFIRLPLQQG